MKLKTKITKKPIKPKVDSLQVSIKLINPQKDQERKKHRRQITNYRSEKHDTTTELTVLEV